MFERPSFCRYVIKELVHAFSCAYIELWMHLGSLESTQEARTLTLLSCSPNFPRASITRYTHAKHEPILNWTNKFSPNMRHCLFLLYQIPLSNHYRRRYLLSSTAALQRSQKYLVSSTRIFVRILDKFLL